MKRPFCANERCFMNALECEDERGAAEVALPTGASRLYTRGWLLVKATGFKYPLCDSCSNVLTMIRGGDAALRHSFGIPLSVEIDRSLGLRPFCANPRCFTHALEVPDQHQSTDVGLPNGQVRSYDRAWLIFETESRRYPVCDTCGNIAAALRGEGEGAPVPEGAALHGELIGPDGKVVDRAEPEPNPDADIDEPRILH